MIGKLFDHKLQFFNQKENIFSVILRSQKDSGLILKTDGLKNQSIVQNETVLSMFRLNHCNILYVFCTLFDVLH